MAERRRRGLTPLALLALLAAIVLAGPWLDGARGVDSTTIDLLGRLSAPDLSAPLGRDELGRDVLARLIEGGRVSLLVGVLAALLSTAIGTLIGLLAGWHGGRLDAALMRATDLALSLPLLPLLIVLAAVDPARLGLGGLPPAVLDLGRIVLLLGLFGWTTVARIVRAGTMSLKEQDFVRAAAAMGARTSTILLRHILPNLSGPLLVAANLAVGHAILAESVLSFLGLGIQPPAASWGSMLTGAQELIWEAPRLAIWPGLLILVTVAAFNLLGDALSDRR